MAMKTNPFRPEPLRVFRAKRSGSGTALSLELNLRPEYNEAGYVADVGGGLFLILASQLGPVAAGAHPTFGWDPKKHPKTITAKLGLMDIQHWLAAIREFRLRRKLPASLTKTSKDGTVTENTAEFFHKNDVGSTIISVFFTEDSATVSLSRGKGDKQQLTMGLQDEVSIERYLSKALDAFLLLGVR